MYLEKLNSIKIKVFTTLALFAFVGCLDGSNDDNPKSGSRRTTTTSVNDALYLLKTNPAFQSVLGQVKDDPKIRDSAFLKNTLDPITSGAVNNFFASEGIDQIRYSENGEDISKNELISGKKTLRKIMQGVLRHLIVDKALSGDFDFSEEGFKSALGDSLPKKNAEIGDIIKAILGDNIILVDLLKKDPNAINILKNSTNKIAKYVGENINDLDIVNLLKLFWIKIMPEKERQHLTILIRSSKSTGEFIPSDEKYNKISEVSATWTVKHFVPEEEAKIKNKLNTEVFNLPNNTTTVLKHMLQYLPRQDSIENELFSLLKQKGCGWFSMVKLYMASINMGKAKIQMPDLNLLIQSADYYRNLTNNIDYAKYIGKLIFGTYNLKSDQKNTVDELLPILRPIIEKILLGIGGLPKRLDEAFGKSFGIKFFYFDNFVEAKNAMENYANKGYLIMPLVYLPDSGTMHYFAYGKSYNGGGYDIYETDLSIEHVPDFNSLNLETLMEFNPDVVKASITDEKEGVKLINAFLGPNGVENIVEVLKDIFIANIGKGPANNPSGVKYAFAISEKK